MFTILVYVIDREKSIDLAMLTHLRSLRRRLGPLMFFCLLILSF